MSVQAIAWALDHRQTGPLAPEVRLVLVALADYADPQGRCAWPAASTLAERLGVSVRAVRRSLSALEQARLIGRGDQRIVSHVRKDRRPVVWDLAVDGRQVALEFDRAAAHLGAEVYDRRRHGVTPTTPRERGDSHDTPQGPRGDTHDAYGVTPASPKPKTEPTHSPSVEKVTHPRARDLEQRQAPTGAVVVQLPRQGPTNRGASCPACGEAVHRSHTCRANALRLDVDEPMPAVVGTCPICSTPDRVLVDGRRCVRCRAALGDVEGEQASLDLGEPQ